MIEPISREKLLEVIAGWVALLDKPWPEPRGMGLYGDDPLAIDVRNQEILRGLAWCCSFEPDPNAARIIRRSAQAPTGKSASWERGRSASETLAFHV